MTISRKRPLFARPAVVVPARPPRKKSGFWRVLWRALVRTCTTIGAVVLIFSVLGMMVAQKAMENADVPIGLPNQMVLMLPLDQSFEEYRATESLGTRQPTLRETIDALDAARTDNRVKGVVASLRGGTYNLAHIYELRAAIKRFRESGKFAYFFTNSFAEQGQGLGSYYLATAFDQIWMQPMGSLVIPGVKAEVPYARELLDKVGITPDLFARKEYKNVFESFTSKEMSPATREAMDGMIADIASYLADEIAADRHMTTAALKAQVDKGLLLDTEARDAGLIDVLDYGDHMIDKIKKDVTGDAESDDLDFVKMGRYTRARTSDKTEASSSLLPAKKPNVALIYAVGEIVSSSDRDAGIIAADSMSAVFMDAIDDEDIKTIVLRIDSPGGSPVASETLRWKILRAQEKGKKVVVSMGATAASGGYWMVSPADHIFATPLTLTGSIGVAGGKFVLGDFFDKVGVNWDSVSWGDNSGLSSFVNPYTDSERARYAALMDNVYDNFVSRVASGRKMDPETADAQAHGRVWTGRQALARKLVDDIGGLDDTLDYVAKDMGLKDRHELNIMVLPKPQSPFEQFAKLLEMQAGMHDWMSTLSQSWIRVKNADDFMVYQDVTLR